MSAPPAPPAADSRCPSLEYLKKLARELIDEAAEVQPAGPEMGVLAGLGPTATYDDWLVAYRRARAAVVNTLDRSFEVAKAYRTMDEFWADSAEQETGESPGAYWDSYENGRRRRLEARLAAAFGAAEAVLLNTGMSAIDVALRALGLPLRAPILMHERAYFESTDLIENVFGQHVQPVLVDMRDAEATRRALTARRPAAVILETAVNGPRCDIPVLEPLLASGVPILIDNSAIGHAMSWDNLAANAEGEVIVAESGTKFLTRSASAGVLYGSGSWIGAARLTARRVGQQLQGRALHHLRPGEICCSQRRTLLHAARARQLENHLRESGTEMAVTSAATAAAGRRDLLAVLISGGASGCLVFVRLGGEQGAAERRHRDCIAGWAAECSAFPRVRAGFGWTETSGRAYGADPLNTRAGEAFIRLSVGCEPRAEIERIATIFCKHASQAMG